MSSFKKNLISFLVILVILAGCAPGAWISDTTDKKYIVRGETTQDVKKDIFDSAKGKGPRSSDRKRKAGRTNGDYQFGVTPEVVSKVIGELCVCTVAVKSIAVKLDVSVIFPDWKDFGNASADCKAKWNTFISALKKHEEGHVKIFNEGRKSIETALRTNWVGKSSVISAPTCKMACDSALNVISRKVKADFNSELKKVGDKQDKYDKDTKHGETQGAVLKNCTK